MSRLAAVARWALTLAVVASVAWAAGPVVWHLRGESGIAVPAPAPAEPRVETAPVDPAPVIALAPFGSRAAPEPVAAPAEETALDLTLRGVTLAATAAAARAMIDDGDATRSYRIGDTVGGRAEVVEIHVDHVMLSVDGTLQTLSFPDGASREAPAPTQTGLDRLRAAVNTGARAEPQRPETIDEHMAKWRERIRRNPAEVLDTIGLIPSDEGYVVAEEHDSGVRRAGLRAGDIVARVNGKQVGDVEEDRSYVDDVAAADLVRLEVVRDGRTIVMSFPLR